MSKNKKTNPTIRQIIICVVAFLLVTSVLGGGCATIAGKLGLKDLFPNMGFIPLFPEDKESIDLDADETSSELESDTESIKESESEPEKESQEAPDVSESVSSSGGNVVDSESEGVGPGENENPGVSGSEGESSGGAELPGGSESENPGESESEKPGSSESEGESENPGESESESESNSNNDDESTSESFPTDVITYKFNGTDLILDGKNINYTHDKVVIEATSSLENKLKTNEITISTVEEYQIVKIVLVCDIRYEFTIEITPGSSIVQQFEDGTITIDVYENGTAQVKINFSRNVEIITLEVSISK